MNELTPGSRSLSIVAITLRVMIGWMRRHVTAGRPNGLKDVSTNPA